MYNNLYCGLRIGGWSNDKTTGTVYDCKVRAYLREKKMKR